VIDEHESEVGSLWVEGRALEVEAPAAVDHGRSRLGIVHIEF
jgi:hypothetical protein